MREQNKFSFHSRYFNVSTKFTLISIVAFAIINKNIYFPYKVCSC